MRCDTTQAVFSIDVVHWISVHRNASHGEFILTTCFCWKLALLDLKDCSELFPVLEVDPVWQCHGPIRRAYFPIEIIVKMSSPYEGAGVRDFSIFSVFSDRSPVGFGCKSLCLKTREFSQMKQNSFILMNYLRFSTFDIKMNEWF